VSRINGGMLWGHNHGVTRADFDIDAFLAQPLTARVATNGPTVRPVWYLWEDRAFWVLTGPWTKLFGRIASDPAVALTVDVCDVTTGLVQQVIAQGRAELLPFDVSRGKRKLSRYLGHDEDLWDDRFRHYLHDDPVEARHRLAAAAPHVPHRHRSQLRRVKGIGAPCPVRLVGGGADVGR
jgi:hypothetical protein